MLHYCQEWCEKARIDINTDKTKIVQFHKSLCPLRREGRIHKWHLNIKQGDTQQYKQIELAENTTFKYLGVTLDQELTMKPLQEQILEKVKKSSGKLQPWT